MAYQKKNKDNDLPKVPAEEVANLARLAEKAAQEDTLAFIRRLKKEPRVRVFGNKMYKESIGSPYTFLFNGLPVSIKFDGTYQEYPKTIAEVLERKLLAIAEANTPKQVNVEI